MRKKYIIELEDNESVYKTINKKDPMIQVFELLSPTPYAAPDIEQVRQKAYDKAYADAVCNCSEGCSHVEQVRKEAYEQGRKDVETQFCSYDACKNRQEEYQRGLVDAWEAAKKIAHCALWDDYRTDSGKLSVYTGDVLDYYTASEAIEKIRQYEQKQEEIKVGDEVATDAGNRASVLYENPDGTQVFVFKSDGTAAWWTKSALHRTGRNFPEIAAVLEKMKE